MWRSFQLWVLIGYFQPLYILRRTLPQQRRLSDVAEIRNAKLMLPYETQQSNTASYYVSKILRKRKCGMDNTKWRWQKGFIEYSSAEMNHGITYIFTHSLSVSALLLEHSYRTPLAVGVGYSFSLR